MTLPTNTILDKIEMPEEERDVLKNLILDYPASKTMLEVVSFTPTQIIDATINLYRMGLVAIELETNETGYTFSIKPTPTGDVEAWEFSKRFPNICKVLKQHFELEPKEEKWH